MDLNQLLYNHQLALMNAERDISGESDNVYLDIARHYAVRLRRYRHQAGIQQY